MWMIAWLLWWRSTEYDQYDEPDNRTFRALTWVVNACVLVVCATLLFVAIGLSLGLAVYFVLRLFGVVA